MILIFFILSIITALLRNGKIKRLSYLKFRSIWLFILAMVIQLSIVVFGATGSYYILKYIKELYIGSYVLLFIGLIINIKYKPIIIIMLGGLMNVFCFMANDGKMPISIEGLKLAGFDNLIRLIQNGKIALYTPLNGATNYGQFAQLITVQKPFPLPQILSIGDIIIYIGIFVLVQVVMLNSDMDRLISRKPRY
ncbi:DUF5317 family protein [Abyssisolibacter fermentans]|uniref:DUF5317 family protein n=1 Tax=Abyssisolibacter fermentans TaxID=1766203 RepID=UPI00082D4B8C|nr:DUF5317 family protein [Abyssisolibacter fermentans]